MHLTLQPDPLPKQAPVTTFGGGDSAEDPMRNFGYSVAAYSIIWALLLGFLLLSWRRQAQLDARIADIERALGEHPGPEPSTGARPVTPMRAGGG